MAKRVVWLNIHIPKCGGTTVLGMCANNFGRGFKDGRGLLGWPSYSAAEVEALLTLHDGITCFSEHRLSANLPYDHPQFAIKAMTCIRDPLDRFLSSYYYSRNHARYIPKAKELTIEDYVDWAVVQKKREDEFNWQTQKLSGRRDQEGLDFIQRLVKEEKLMLFPLSRLNEACLYLERKHAEYFKDCSYAVRNVSKKDRQSLSEELRRTILDAAKMDTELLRIANEQMDRFCAEIFVSDKDREQALQSLRKRCEKREQQERSFVMKFRRLLHVYAVRLERRLALPQHT